MKKAFLGIDTSNYTTSLCLIDEDMNIIAEERRLLPVKEGEKGLRQSDAVFHHTVALPCLADKLFDGVDVKFCATGVSASPRDAEGSYMPCFLTGVSFAKGFSCGANTPIYHFSHQAGHIMAAAVSGGAAHILEKEFISFHVSGGTTEALLVSPTDKGLSCKIIGGSLDLNAGQAIDRCGVNMGLSFPCGRKMDELSQKSEKEFSPKISANGSYFNLSGLENLTSKMLSKGESPEDISKFTFAFIAKSLLNCCNSIRTEYPEYPVLFAGGVLSNTYIRQVLRGLDNVYFAKPEYSCDNAFGIACLARERYFKEN